jgi:potassium efflux system protein
MGYQYTAGTLFESLVASAWLALALLVLQQMIVRWLIVTRRKLALQAALDRQAARRAQGERPAPGMAAELAQGAITEEQDVDLASLDEQTRRLVNALIGFAGVVALWLLWADMIPAFTLLDRFALWHYQGVVDGVEQRVPVTVADMALVVLIVIAAVIAARNLPGLIEILLLQMSSVSAGSRYTIKTLLSYTISAVAFLTAFSTLGLSWNQVQWLVAALGVGIGFGLQEIVANFISGLIILFERPVRVGDVVTIGDTTGVVTNIQIRATTIRNWDKQELLVPNKEFITGRLLNWSLSDPLNRLTVPVGIAYGNDIERALGLLREVADSNPRVLADPEPTASVEGFGDNAVNLALRCHLGSLDYRIAVTTELHLAIERAFRGHGIEISYPQRDIHLRSAAPLDLRLHPVPGAAPPPGPSTPGPDH